MYTTNNVNVLQVKHSAAFARLCMHEGVQTVVAKLVSHLSFSGKVLMVFCFSAGGGVGGGWRLFRKGQSQRLPKHTGFPTDHDYMTIEGEWVPTYL